MTPGASVHAERPRTDGVPRPRRWLLHGARPFCAWLVRRRYRVVVHGAEHVPATGPVVIAANHIGVVDGPLMAIFAPRPVHALTKIEMFRGFLGRFLTAAGQIPLDRMHTDPRAVRLSVQVLREGGVVGIFPEGTRGSGELELFHRGAAYLAMVTGAPVVPLMMSGSREPGGSSSSLPRGGATIELVFGPPHVVDAVSWPRTRDDVGKASRLLRARMLADLQESIRVTGRSLPGPLPAGQHEPDPGGGVTEKSA
ncbi:lysophospholipid acyltransferase family protein [Nocardioides rubriscoriae]|uniref:lysophospholipid acyltransferase family protein n=1 Tax=Nocardioides rubriscoriae TaxID=642762 RepID=UPI0011DF5AB4|nr:lysophospholipid acyltransferase family protein [Nocardioides rubriscoriae]